MLSYSIWHGLPLSARVKICDAFGIAKIGPTHVFDNRIVSDGFKFQDIEKRITVEALQAYTGSKEKDFNTLWNLMADKLEGREPAELIVQNVPDEEAPVVIKSNEISDIKDNKDGTHTLTIKEKKPAGKKAKKSK